MGISRMEIIFNDYITRFVSYFVEDAPKLYNDEVTNKLIHPGEYGMYRIGECSLFRE